MKNRGLWILLALLVVLGGYVAWDLRSEKKEELRKELGSALFTLKPDQISEMTLEKGGRVTRLERTVDGWRLVEPLQDWADNSFTEDFVQKAAMDKSHDVAKEGEGIDWKLFGFEPPLGKISFKNSAGETQSLEVATVQNFEKLDLGRRPGENKVLVIPANWQGYVQKEALDFRDKRFFRGRLGAVEEIEWTNSRGKFRLTSKEGRWSSPDQPDWALDQNRVREILTALNETRVADFLLERAPSPSDRRKFGLEKPAVTVRLKLKDKTWVGELALDSSKEIVGVTSDPAFVLKMESGQLEKFTQPELATLRDGKLPFAFDKAAVRKIDVHSPLKKARFQKKETWELIDGGAASADPDKIQIFLDRLRESSVLRYQGVGRAAELEKSDVARVILFDEENAPLFEMVWSFAPKKMKFDGEEKSVYIARTDRFREHFLFDSLTLNRWGLHELTKAPSSEPAPPGEAP